MSKFMKIVQKPVLGETYIISQFCCCLGSLKSGTLLIGIIYTMISLLTVSVSFSYNPSVDPVSTEPLAQSGYELGIYGINALVTLMKVTSIIWLIINLGLMYGTINSKPDFVAPWVGWHLVLFFLQIIVGVWCGDVLIESMTAHAVELGTLIVAFVIHECVMLYAWIVVNSFYLQLKKRKIIEFKPIGRLERRPVFEENDISPSNDDWMDHPTSTNADYFLPGRRNIPQIHTDC